MVIENSKNSPEDEMREAIEKTKPNYTSNALRKLPLSFYLILSIFIFFVIYMVYLSPSHPWATKILTMKDGVQIESYTINSTIKMFGIIAVIIFGIYLFTAGKEPKPISDREAKEIIRADVKWKQENTGEFPRGEYIQFPNCELPRKYTGKTETYKKWYIFFGIKDKGYVRKWIGKVDPYSGMILGYEETDFGWDKSVTKDQTVVIPEKHRLTKKVDDMLWGKE